MREYTPENVTELKSNEVFVFGSNLQGWHRRGAAHTAKDNFGAVYGVGIGLQGQSYALPTCSWIGKDTLEPLPLHEITTHLLNFYKFAGENSELVFYMTKIGCGLAGWTVADIAPLFLENEIHRPKNVVLPIEFVSEEQKF